MGCNQCQEGDVKISQVLQSTSYTRCRRLMGRVNLLLPLFHFLDVVVFIVGPILSTVTNTVIFFEPYGLQVQILWGLIVPYVVIWGVAKIKIICMCILFLILGFMHVESL